MVSPALRAEVIWDQDSVLWAMNVLHFRPSATGVVDQATADGLAFVLTNSFATVGPPGTTTLKANISSSVRLHSVNISDLREVNPTKFSATILNPGTGGLDQVADVCSLPVEFNVGGGTANGRVYQWGYSQGANQPTGRPTLQAIDATIGFWELIRSQANTVVDIEALVVLSRTRGGLPSNDTADVQSVQRTPTMVAAGWSTQRRRRDGLQVIQ